MARAMSFAPQCPHAELGREAERRTLGNGLVMYGALCQPQSAVFRVSSRRAQRGALGVALNGAQVDDVWYGWSGPVPARSFSEIPPGGEAVGIPVVLYVGNDNCTGSDGRPLNLPPGRHVVRVADIFEPIDPSVAGARPISQPVAIEILSAGGKVVADKSASEVGN